MMEGSKNIFVFVVCGEKSHIETLHFSLQALKGQSQNEIIVVTDPNRNEIPVVHNSVIDIKTPENLSNHQASIYLKTGLHKFLPAKNNYCYLDSDVVALNKNVDEIFNHFKSPITFATDHCRIDAFSPSAVNCGCREKFLSDYEKLQQHLKHFDEIILPQLTYIDACNGEIKKLVEESKINKWSYAIRTLRFFMPGKYYILNENYKMDKKTGRWYNKNGVLLWYEHKDNIRYTEEQTGFSFDRENLRWHGGSLGSLCCHHLAEAIQKKFSIEISPSNWQHWNGGVFLFNEESREFLENWHTDTLEIFKDPYWKTRDQGTLATTAWQFGLQNHATLPINYNFIADYNRPFVQYLGNLSFYLDKLNKTIHPDFIHIYHHWGDEQWKVWQDVEEHILAPHAT